MCLLESLSVGLLALSMSLFIRLFESINPNRCLYPARPLQLQPQDDRSPGVGRISLAMRCKFGPATTAPPGWAEFHSLCGANSAQRGTRPSGAEFGPAL